MESVDTTGRKRMLAAAFLGWFSAGLQMGLLPLSARPAARDLLARLQEGTGQLDEAVVGLWYARYLAAFLLGGAFGGLLFGRLGDKAGRVRAMGFSILCFSLATGISGLAQSLELLLLLRFLTGLGVGGMWPAGVALVSEAWPDRSRPTVAGVMGTAANLGILGIALLGFYFKVTPQTWRTAMIWGCIPVVLGILVFFLVPESPRWLAARSLPNPGHSGVPILEVFTPPFLNRTLIGIALGTIPLLGTWGSGKWLLPWADATLHADAASTQAVWAFGAALGSAIGGGLASLLGRRTTYFVISLLTLGLNLSIYRFLDPRNPLFLPFVFLLGLIATVFFGWLPLYLPELYPTRIRATGSGVTYNFGRFASAAGVLGAGALMTAFQGDYARVGETTAWVNGLGMVVILLAPDTQDVGFRKATEEEPV